MPAKKATPSHSSHESREPATCHTSVLMNRNVMNSNSSGSALVTMR